MAKRVKATILYASKTGELQGYEKTLCEIFMHVFDAKVMSMDEFDVVQLKHEKLVLVVTSTSGNGGPPGNGEKFHAALMEMRHPTYNMEDRKGYKVQFNSVSLSSDTQKSLRDKREPKVDFESTGPLANIRFSVFGLGSRAQPHFCVFARAMDALFEELGGERILQMGEGDELRGQARSFRTWAKKVFKAACNVFCVGDDGNIEKANNSLISKDRSWENNKFRLTHKPDMPDRLAAIYSMHKRKAYGVKLMTRKKLQKSNFNLSTYFLEFNTNNQEEFKYEAGDEVGFFPGNPEESVISLIDKLEDAPPINAIITREFLEKRSSALGLNSNCTKERNIPPCTIYQALKYFLNISTPPSPLLLQQFAPLASNDKEKKELEVLSRGLEAYEAWKYYNNPTVLEVLEMFPSLQIPFTLLLTQLPIVGPRFYCMASSPISCPGEFHLIIVVLKYRTREGSGPIHSGISSTWLSTVDMDEIIPCVIRGAPHFRMTKDPKLPCILVGPGTAIGSFRSFWQQRQYDFENNGIEFCPMILVIGCRHSKKEHAFLDEAVEAKNEGVLGGLYIAYSQEPGKPKKYVHHVLGEQLSDTVYRCLNDRGGHIYVSGDKILSSNVLQTMQQIIKVQGNMSLEDAGSYIIKLRGENRYHERIFTVRDSEQDVCY